MALVTAVDAILATGHVLCCSKPGRAAVSALLTRGRPAYHTGKSRRRRGSGTTAPMQTSSGKHVCLSLLAYSEDLTVTRINALRHLARAVQTNAARRAREECTCALSTPATGDWRIAAGRRRRAEGHRTGRPGSTHGAPADMPANLQRSSRFLVARGVYLFDRLATFLQQRRVTLAHMAGFSAVAIRLSTTAKIRAVRHMERRAASHTFAPR